MLVDITTVEDAVRYAQRIAARMSKDPEVDSVAGEAAWRALWTYEEERGVKVSWWIAHLTKQAVIQYWRRISKLRKREKLMDELWWMEQTKAGRVPQDGHKFRYDEDNLVNKVSGEEDDGVDVLATDWQLLVESFVLRWPLDVIARERGVSLGKAREMRKAAVSRLEAAC